MNTNTIKAKAFYEAWFKSVKGQEKKMLELWKNPTEFTKFIKGDDESILSKVAQEIELEVYQQDYYSIDSIFYLKEDLIVNPMRAKFWFKRIRIAFEHENQFDRGVLEELSHLLILNSELRVLVIYPNDTPWDALKEYHEIIKSVDNNNEILISGGFLIICGYENKFEWEGFIYNGTEQWQKI